MFCVYIFVTSPSLPHIFHQSNWTLKVTQFFPYMEVFLCKLEIYCCFNSFSLFLISLLSLYFLVFQILSQNSIDSNFMNINLVNLFTKYMLYFYVYFFPINPTFGTCFTYLSNIVAHALFFLRYRLLLTF